MEVRWTFFREDGAIEVTVETGDLLFVPEGVPHDVSTPFQSEHIVFAFAAKG